MAGSTPWFDALRQQVDRWIAPLGARALRAVGARLGGRPGGLRDTLVSWWTDVVLAPTPGARPASPPPATTPTPETAAVSPPPPPVDPWAGFVRLASTARPREGEVLEAVLDGVSLAVGCVGGELFCVDSACPHAGGPLCDGGLEGHRLECPLHGWGFDVRSGACDVQPRFVLPVHAIRERDGALWVRLADGATPR